MDVRFLVQWNCSSSSLTRSATELSASPVVHESSPVYGGAVDGTAPSVPEIHPLETLHNSLTLNQLTTFLERMINAKMTTPWASPRPPSTPVQRHVSSCGYGESVVNDGGLSSGSFWYSDSDAVDLDAECKQSFSTAVSDDVTKQLEKIT